MKFIKVFVFLSLLLNSIGAFAAVADQFNVTFSKDEVIAGEAIDVTIEAVDSNGNTVTDYMGNIVGFSETDNEATIPEQLASDDGYTFQLSDEGIVKFENSVKFQSAGMQEMSIYDTDGDAIGVGKIKVIPKITGGSNEKIDILSPEDGLTIGKDFISVSGESKKNHKILIVLNDKTEFTTITNSQGTFEKEISPLESGENLIQAYILDSDDKKIGESEKVLIKADVSKPNFRKVTLSPLNETGEIEEGKNVIVNVFASIGLNEVNLIVNDSIVKLEETDDGVYVGNFNAPDFDDSLESNKYSLDLVMKDNLGHSVDEKAIADIIVTKVDLPAATNSGSEAQITEKVEENGDSNIIPEENEFDITGLKLVKLKNKSVLTWDKTDGAEGYNVYKKMGEDELVLVETVTEPRFEVEITGEEIKYQLFAVKAFKKNNLEKTYEGNLSHATEIQTGPKFIILMLLSLLIGIGFAIIKRRKA